MFFYWLEFCAWPNKYYFLLEIWWMSQLNKNNMARKVEIEKYLARKLDIRSVSEQEDGSHVG